MLADFAQLQLDAGGAQVAHALVGGQRGLGRIRIYAQVVAMATASCSAMQAP